MIYLSLMRTPLASHRLSTQIRSVLAARGQSVRAAERLAGMPQRSMQAVLDGHIPSVDRAAAIAAALDLELTIRPRGGVSDPAPDPSAPPPGSVSRIRETDLDPSGPPSGVASEPVADRHIAELLAAIADEYEALNGDGRASLLTRIWGLHPELRERAAARSGPRLARLARGGGRA